MGPLEQELHALMGEALNAFETAFQAGHINAKELAGGVGAILASQQEAILRLAAAVDELRSTS